MRAVWKFRIMDGRGVQVGKVEIPAGAILTHVGMQGAQLFLWAEVDPDAPTVTRHFVVYGTGHRIRTDGIYVGSAIDGEFVWHLYEHTSGAA